MMLLRSTALHFLVTERDVQFNSFTSRVGFTVTDFILNGKDFIIYEANESSGCNY